MRIKRHKRTIDRPVPESRWISTDGHGDFSGIFSPRTQAGVTVNDRTALALAAAYAAINIIASKLASVDFYVAEMEGRDVGAPAPAHPVDDLVSARPNDWTNNYNFRQTAMVHVLTRGNAYVEIVRNGRGRPDRLELLAPWDVSPEWNDQKVLEYRLSNGRTLPASDVIHLRGLGTDGVHGLSPIGLFAETFGLAIAARTHQASMYGNSCRIEGFIEIPGNSKASPTSNQTLADMEERHQGPYRAGILGKLEGGAKFVPNTFSPVDSDLIASRNLDVREIENIYNLPPGWLSTMATGSGASEDQLLALYTRTLSPWITMFQQEFHGKLFGPTEYYRFAVTHDPMSLVRGTLQAMASWCESLFKMAAITPDEVRSRFGLVPRGNDNTYLETNNFNPVSKDSPDGPPDPALATAKPDPKPDVEDIPIRGTEETREAPPTPAPAPLPLDALRPVLADPLGRMIRRECEAIRKAASKERFDLWMDEFYPRHANVLADAIRPAIGAIDAFVGTTRNPVFAASGIVAESRARLTDLMTTHTPDEMPDAVEPLCLAWEADRAREIVDSVMGGSDAGNRT